MVKKAKGKNGKKGKKNSKDDIKRIKKLIKQELYSNYTMGKFNSQDINLLEFQKKPEDNEKEYYMKYTKYMSEEFNSTIVNMLIIYIKQSKTFPAPYQIEPNFINKFINLIKRLFINELEFSFFTILLDKMGWTHQTIDHWIYFCILGILAKKILGNEEESSLLIDFFSSKNEEFFDFYTTLGEEEIIANYEKESVSIKKINERFRQLTRPINSYCRHNFIYYNGVVDKIVKWSQPYGAESNGNQLNNDELYLINDNDNNNNNNNENVDEPTKQKNENAFGHLYQLNYDTIKNTTINNFSSFYNNNLQPMHSGDFNEQGRNYINENNANMRSYIMNDMNYPNNYFFGGLNLMNKSNSQFSFKSRKND